MWIDRLLHSNTRNALEATARFAEARHEVLSENLANIDTPDYHARQLDPRAFQRSLREALDRAGEGGRPAPLELRGNAQFSLDKSGRAAVKPVEVPAENVLFHDGTNASLERNMTDVAENTLLYQLALARLKSSFETLFSAIRGRMA